MKLVNQYFENQLNNTVMKEIAENDLKELATIHGMHCLSVFIPTHVTGDKDILAGDALVLKKELKEIKRKLPARGMAPAEIEEWVSPIQELADDPEFWSRQEGGLALFLSDDLFKKYVLPEQFAPYHYVSTEFYITPLFPAVATHKDFFLLTLELDEVKLFKGNREGLQELDISKKVPAGMKEVVGLDYEEKSLQFKSQQQGHGNSVFYGHGEGDDKKMEINKYLRAVDKGLVKLIKDEKVPVVMAGADYLCAMYRELSSLHNLNDRHISGSPKLMGLQSLHNKALVLLQPYFNKIKKDKSEAFRQLQGTPKTANSIDYIVPAAIQGKIDTLFILKNQDVFGMYDEVSDKVEYKEGAELAEVSLFNLAAKEAFLHGANVYMVDKDEMPDGFSHINALYRF